jgi:AcrR family transcriptional regulator
VARVTRVKGVTTQESRRNRRLERPRESVLQAAWDLLVERGLAELTLAELGRRLETSAGHLLYYFGSKDGLLLEVLKWSEAEQAVERAEILASDVPALERARRFCEVYLPYAEGDPRWLLWVELWPRLLREPSLREPREALDQAWYADLVPLLEEMGADNPGVVARRVLSLLDGLSVGLLIGESGLTRESAWEHVRALLP